MNDKVAIVGSGLVGRAWAISFARGGHDVVLFDTDDTAVANALRTVEMLWGGGEEIASIVADVNRWSPQCKRRTT